MSLRTRVETKLQEARDLAAEHFKHKARSESDEELAYAHTAIERILEHNVFNVTCPECREEDGGGNRAQTASEDPRAAEAEEPTETCDYCGKKFPRGTLRRDDVDISLIYCNDCPPSERGPRYLAHFMGKTPNNKNDDFIGTPAEWDCTDQLKTLLSWEDGTIDQILAVHGHWRYETQGEDILKADPAAPAWVRAWSGPFTITVTRKEG